MPAIFGPFGPGECVDQGLQGVMDLLDSANQLYNPNAFINPQAENILAMVNGRQTVWDGLHFFMAGPPPLMEPQLSQAMALSAQLDRFKVAQEGFATWTNFLSGKSPNFPNAELEYLFNYFGKAIPAQWPLLAAAGFVGLMGMATGGTQVEYALCQVEPDDPCALIKKIFAAILNAGTFLLNTVIAGFNTMVDFAEKMLTYLAMVTAFIDDFINMILDGVMTVINLIKKGLQFALAKLFEALKIHPCMKQIMKDICSPELADAVGLPLSPSPFMVNA